jgi:hypothetical protein
LVLNWGFELLEPAKDLIVGILEVDPNFANEGNIVYDSCD